MSDSQYKIKLDKYNTAAIDSYLEYRRFFQERILEGEGQYYYLYCHRTQMLARIVGDDDGGNIMSPEEYEAYKNKVIPQRMKNRLYTAYTSPLGMDCKLIGPETLCFCQHRYKQHQTDFETIPDERPIPLPCRVRGCRCTTYHYVPMNGGQPIGCSCKHYADNHSEKPPFLCKKGDCSKCAGFRNCCTCACGAGHMEHMMTVETREEREVRGHPIGQATPYAAMGGITGFSSLADGYARLDPSGQGAPDDEWLNRPITASDSPFLRANVRSVKAHVMGKGMHGPDDALFHDQQERISGMRRPGESDMDFFERRFQEKLKVHPSSSRGGGFRSVDVRPAARKAHPKSPSTSGISSISSKKNIYK